MSVFLTNSLRIQDDIIHSCWSKYISTEDIKEERGVDVFEKKYKYIVDQGNGVLELSLPGRNLWELSQRV